MSESRKANFEKLAIAIIKEAHIAGEVWFFESAWGKTLIAGLGVDVDCFTEARKTKARKKRKYRRSEEA